MRKLKPLIVLKLIQLQCKHWHRRINFSEISVADYDAVFYPGAVVQLWDLAEDPIQIL